MNDESFSKIVPISSIGRQGLKATFAANAEERKALAERFGISELLEFDGQYFLNRDADADDFLLEGTFRARLVQPCVLTLEPVEEDVAGEFRVLFLSDHDEDEELSAEAEQRFAEEDIEPLVGDSIDVGEVVAQYLAMSINPYPRKPGARVEDASTDRVSVQSEEAALAERSPFAGLKILQDGG